MRQYRAKQGATTGIRGRKPTQPCGTPAAYRRHRRNGEDPCDRCEAAMSEWNHQQYLARKARKLEADG